MKWLVLVLAASVASLAACSVAPSPVAPSAVATAAPSWLVSGFVPDFYRAFVQNGFESPTRLEPVRVVQHPFRVYLSADP